MRILFVVFSFLLCIGCASYVEVVSYREPVDKIRAELIANESTTSGDFFKTRNFHRGLMNETTQPKMAPYPGMDSIFRLMRLAADSVVIQRMHYDKFFYAVDSLQRFKPKVKRDGDDVLLINNAVAAGEKFKMVSAVYMAEYSLLSDQYNQLREESKFRFFTQLEYADMVNTRLIQWQDSLEQVGRFIGAGKADLKSRYPTQKGEEFFAHYRYISELEQMLKLFDNSLMQLQNSLSRVEGGNQEEFYYFGPFIPERREYQATEGIINQLMLHMADCRAKYQEYQASYGR
ncbi:MAG: hypothetical protein ACKVOK_15995 [Flavobacteriales bacterium]